MKKRLLTTALILFSITNAYSENEYLLIFKPNKNLKYKVTLNPMPKYIDSKVQKYFLSQLSQNSLLNISYTESKDGNINVLYDLNLYKKRSCCNPLTYPAYAYTYHGIIENSITPSGHFITNTRDELKMGCVWGFNLWTIKPKQKLQGKLIPCYFPKRRIQAQSKWTNEYEVQEDKKKAAVTIKYTLLNVINDIALIEGTINDSIIQIKGEFDITKGCWKVFKMIYLHEDKKVTFLSYKLIKEAVEFLI